MRTDSGGRDLFIVDNSVSGWKGLRYLEEWTSIAKSFDIATGYFEIGALLELDGKWQRLDKIRILMGADTTHRTRALLLEAIRSQASGKLDASLEGEKSANPFLNGVKGILEGLGNGKIEVRVYDKEKFHAKAYITHARLEVVGSQALVGSSNFTKPGLTQNIELNVQIQSAREVAQLQEWFEIHWNEAKEFSGEIVSIIERHVREYTPFDVYTKALQEYFRGHELTDTEWEESRSRMFHKIDRYQKEAYWALMKIAQQHGGAFLCDGVGLGKTFVGLMLIERLVVHEGKRVLLLAPKAAKDGVWDPHLKDWLPHIGGVSGGGDFSNLAVFSHTDLNRTGNFPERFKRIADLVDVVIVDEAHHFRNQGSRGSEEEEGRDRSRYYRLFDLLDSSTRNKTIYMLTATPINNRLSDFRHMAELFTRQDQAYFAKTLGVNNLQAHFNQLEKSLRQKVGHDVVDISEQMADAQEILNSDSVFRHLVVQRSRAYAKESQLKETGKAAAFPTRSAPEVADYSIRKTYGRLLDLFEKAFERKTPLFTLAMYYPLHWYKGKDKSIDPLQEGRQQQVVGLIRTQFLKRFESSVTAFELSCNRLLGKMLAFIEVHSASPTEKNRLERWKRQNAEILGYVSERQLDLWKDEGEEPEDEDIVTDELLAAVETLDPEDYIIDEMIAETFLDLDEIVRFLEEARKFKPANDDKLQKLIRLLRSKELANQKVLVFSEFADTARYLKKRLIEAKIDGVEQVDSGSKTNRADVIKRFSPYYNRFSSGALIDAGLSEIRVLISTDVLSEGLNLQDATRMINYDIHWNPVRLMQRIGRVDRRMNPDVEAQIVKDHPEQKPLRGKVKFWNFLPPDELNKLLSLYTTVTRKTLLISRTLGIEGKKLLTPDDDFDALRDFNHAYEGTRTAVEDLHLEYQSLLQSLPNLEAHLKKLPGSIFSGRRRVPETCQGVFFCYALPALDRIKGEFTEEAGTSRWYLFDMNTGSILEEPGAIVSSIKSETTTPRLCSMEPKTLIEARGKVEKHIKNTYLKRVDAPVGVKPILRCWMELNEG